MWYQEPTYRVRENTNCCEYMVKGCLQGVVLFRIGNDGVAISPSLFVAWLIPCSQILRLVAPTSQDFCFKQVQVVHFASSSVEDGRLNNRDGSRLELYRTPFVGEFGLGAEEIGGHEF